MIYITWQLFSYQFHEMIWRKYVLGKENQIGQFIVSPTLFHKRFRMTKLKSLTSYSSPVFSFWQKFTWEWINSCLKNLVLLFFPLNCLRLKSKKFSTEGVVSVYKIWLLGVRRTTPFMLEFMIYLCLVLLFNPNLVFSQYTKSAFEVWLAHFLPLMESG